MKLHYFKPDTANLNFGDEINKDLWEYYFPDFFDYNFKDVFFGIGTILRAANKFYPKSKIIIFGSGSHCSNYLLNNKTEIYFVRGPLTADSLGIAQSYAITDPALLIDKVFPVTNPVKKFKFGYIPHFSVENKEYVKAVKAAGIHFITPNQCPKNVIDQINSCEVIITEAMHGAIVSDAYNIPWIPVFSYKSFNHFKWMDWAKSLKLEIKINKLPRLHSKSNIKSNIKRQLFTYKLKKIKNKTQYLSSISLRQNLKRQLLKEIDKFKKNYKLPLS